MDLNNIQPADVANTKIPEKVGLLSLAPDTRNTIYEMVYSHHKRSFQTITVCSEKGYREVPAAISRTCRQVRLETLPYFFELGLVISVIRSRSDMLACREWLNFTPEPALALIRGIRIKHTHCQPPEVRSCNLNFELGLDKIESPVSYWGDRRSGCKACCSDPGKEDCRPIVDLVLKEMYAGGRITRTGVDFIFDLLEPLTT